jgi:hypothetical protein
VTTSSLVVESSNVVAESVASFCFFIRSSLLKEYNIATSDHGIINCLVVSGSLIVALYIG